MTNQYSSSSMDVLTAIETRRSIRVFTQEPISEQVIDTLLYAAQLAPTAMGQAPWRMVVIDDEEILTSLANSSRYAKMLANAPLAILICGDRKVQPLDELLFADLSAATENILLAATGLGIGSCWCGVVKGQNFHQQVKEICHLPEHIQPFSIIALGHPAEKRENTREISPRKVFRNRYTDEQ